MHAPEEWTALAPIKERPSFKFGPLDQPSMDLMLLQVKANFSLLTPNAIVQGGLLRWRRPRHTHVLIKVLLMVLEFL